MHLHKIDKLRTRNLYAISLKLSRAEIINNLQKNKLKLDHSIIEEFGRKYRFHPTKSRDLFETYDAFTDEALKAVYDCFINDEYSARYDSKGRFLEYRFGQWLTDKDKQVERIEIDKKIQGIGEIDVVGYDKEKKMVCIGECKARKNKASKEQIDPWLRSVELLFRRSENALKRAYFVNVAGFSDGIKTRMLENKNLDSKGLLKMKWGLDFDSEFLLSKKGVNIFLCEERAGKIMQVFP
jgi:hypothetical protein